jgi:hypothetical protein
LKKYPLVSIIVVNFNGKHHLRNCINSLKKTAYPNFEVILVDNGSTDESVDLIKNNFGWVKLLENEKNLGPIKGRNIGASIARGELIVFLDNDTEVDSKWLSDLVKVMVKNKSIGICACKVKFFSNRDLINSAGMGCDIYGFAFSRGLICRGNYEKDEGQYDKEEEVFAGYAAAMMIRKDVLDEVNYLNSDFGMYYEEIDLSWKVRIAGYKVVYSPKSIVYHKMTGPKSSFTRKIKYYTEMNRLRTVIQNYSLSMLFKIIPIYSFLKLSEFLIYIIYRKFDDAIGVASGIFGFFKKFPKVLLDRIVVQKLRKVNDDEIIKYMEKHSIELSMFLKGYGKYVLS